MLWAVVLALGTVGAAPAGNAAAGHAPGAAAGPDSFAVVENYGAAFDRLATEITAQLPKKKVLLVWVLDRSLSMDDDRDRIASGIERLYQEVGKAPNAQPDDLMMGVVGYTNTAQSQTPKPTANPQEVRAAIRAVKPDTSSAPSEMQCDAIAFANDTFSRAARSGGRQLILVLATDESGDAATNVSKLEATIKRVKDAKCIVHVLGIEAVFGLPSANKTWVDKATNTTHRLQSDRGPETAQPEVLLHDGYRRRTDMIPSGFGPYEQMRIARETGGIFLMLPSDEMSLAARDAGKIDAEALRPYLPDLEARDKYATERDKSKLRKAVAKIVADLDPLQAAKAPRIEMNMGPLPLVQAQFSAAAAEEMKKAQSVIKYLQQAQKELEAVAGERAKETSPRWRANYDLLYAQVVAYQARLTEYGWQLAEAAKKLPPLKMAAGPRPTTGWYVATVETLIKPTVSEPLRDKAAGLLREIQKEYPATPWAQAAKSELERGYGVELREGREESRGRTGFGAPRF